jgi:predicted  nucleic acid-binding Zn-ribbon protein
MTEQKKRARWTRPNSTIRDALEKCRAAAEGLREFAGVLEAEAEKVDQRIANGETELTPEDRERMERSARG